MLTQVYTARSLKYFVSDVAGSWISAIHVDCVYNIPTDVGPYPFPIQAWEVMMSEGHLTYQCYIATASGWLENSFQPQSLFRSSEYLCTDFQH